MTQNQYIARARKRINIINDGTDDLFDHVDDLILENIINLMSKNLAPGEISAFAVSKIYKSNEWDKIQKSLDRYKDSNLKRLKATFYNEIEDASESFPQSIFRTEDIAPFFNDIENALNNQSRSLLDLVKGSENDAMAMIRVFAAGQFTDNISRLTDYYHSYVKSKTRAQIKTELITFQNDAYNLMRTNFFEGIHSGPVEKLYKYVGPRDSLNRKICSKYIGQSKTAAEWKKIPNGQNGNMWDHRGGYRCRHQFVLDINAMQKELDKIGQAKEN